MSTNLPPSERPTPTQPLDRDRLRDRQVSLPISSLVALVAALGAGGISTGVTEGRAASAVERLELRMDARLSALEREIQRQAEDYRAGMARVEAEGRDQEQRLRALELKEERRGARESSGPR